MKKFIPVFLSSLCLSASVAFTQGCHAFDSNVVNIGGDHFIKHVKLLKLPKEKVDARVNVSFFGFGEKDYRNGIVRFTNSSSSVDLGMSNVPVLDQGEYGTCVTFSSTAALDAKLGRGDFVSQQCSLALDMGLGNNYWDGAYYPSEILDPLKASGVVQKSRCPSDYPDVGQQLSAEAYQALADVQASQEAKALSYLYIPKANLNSVKTALRQGHRVLMAFSLDGSNQEAVQGFPVKMGGKQYVGGLWACKQGSSVNHCKKSYAGHEVLIVGYDDNQQLLKIRNSWSDSMGENGEYYMSYSYFSSMAVDNTIVY